MDAEAFGWVLAGFLCLVGCYGEVVKGEVRSSRGRGGEGWRRWMGG